ncbi:MAG: DUF1343 domain-containing protein [Bacteroidales bacterium]|nr:DUF1343 domain-containing protein [Bacteroidales bacterium]
MLGDEREDIYLPIMKGRRVAVFSNHSGIVGDRSEGLLYPAGRIGDFVSGSIVPAAAAGSASVSSSVAAGSSSVAGGSNFAVEEHALLEASLLAPFGTPAPDADSVIYGPHILDLLLSRGVNVTAIFSPEHGFRGDADAGQSVSSSVDAATGVPILSLYSKGDHIPSAEDMSKFDLLVVDIQDVGLRYYTYYITMHHLMEACAIYGKTMLILDRPNPNGFYVDGPVLDLHFKSGIGWLPIPTVHGMTLGELALLIQGEGWLDCQGKSLDLQVVPCLNYRHSTLYRLLRAPSPNLKDMKSIYLYSSICCFEGTVFTAGRGTDWPFTIYGCPDASPDPSWPVFRFTPRSMPGALKPRYQGQECLGRNLRDLPFEDILRQGIDLRFVEDALRSVGSSPDFFQPNNAFEKRVGVDWIARMLLDGFSSADIEARWQPDIEAFKALRRPYLLYPEE